MNKLNCLYWEMVEHDAGDAWMIQHFTKVYQYAKIIGQGENLDEGELETLLAAALVHDIGIRPAREKYGDSSGKNQEAEGPEVAKKVLEKVGFDHDAVDRVCYLVGHHHTYDSVDGLDYQILIEADFLVNLYENNSDLSARESAFNKIFKTDTGKALFQKMYVGSESE
ncbi:HD domain-containing protein [Fusibacter tunisiensis]|uniref:HD domain-containing protein n=1 Tax=Fusibacter tunisiensis TaxID=1008308 RepID=A0ABS2MUJ8_9FIRM|nr:HD domain-containing protein [Fusibacter tunisiensis]MBM7562937.1 hypothetical protein [Fusibacter tunisiensis]